jgi:hypothetical protein
MISKELLKEVILNEYDVLEITIENDGLLYWNGGKETTYPYFLIEPGCMNLYELAHKCKEWAYYKHDKMIFQIAYFPKRKYAIKDFDTPLDEWFRKKITLSDMFGAETEPEAIFKACQWILENKDKK